MKHESFSIAKINHSTRNRPDIAARLLKRELFQTVAYLVFMANAYPNISEIPTDASFLNIKLNYRKTVKLLVLEHFHRKQR